jgi:hypothetical protein
LLQLNAARLRGHSGRRNSTGSTIDY